METWAALLRFLEEPAADKLSDRAIAGRFGVGHPKVARVRAARRQAVGAESATRSVEHKISGHRPSDQVEHKPPWPVPEAVSTRLADVETRFARKATEAWVSLFRATTKTFPPLSPELQRYRDELRETLERTGMPADPPDFLDQRRRR
jgi:hypothetical protein